ncbi:MAG: SGNH/GDSL hydrolase family protein [Kiritimatiellia bacterium]|jgi:lysophospholipase L1-like esterase
MRFLDCTPAADCPLKVFGLPPFHEGEGFSRCHRAILEAIPRIAGLGRRSCGGRIRFRTTSPSVTLRMTVERVGVDLGIAIFGASSADVYAGDGPIARFLGLLNPEAYSDGAITVEKSFRLPEGEQAVNVLLPRNETVTAFSAGVEDGHGIAPPLPFRNARPVAFYGSSITEGGCSTRVGCNYVSQLSRRLGIDFVNYGLSGNARGAPEFADYILSQDPCALVFDYDHNAPTLQWLADTHRAFFQRIRAARPDLPVLMMARPDFILDSDAGERRAVVRATYDAAIADGDRRVWFVDSRAFFPEARLFECSVDTVHPNDLGFTFMADAVEPVLAGMLGLR